MKVSFKILLLFVIVIFSLGASSCNNEPTKVNYSEGIFSVPLGNAYNYSDILVKRVIDGDTLELANGERVRLIGIDTPEVHESKKLYKDAERSSQDVGAIKKMGQRAKDFTKSLVEGKTVSLEFDVEKYDIYKRLLAYVYLKDGTFVNAEIVRQGYASLMTFPPNIKYAETFHKLYTEARQQKKGLWGK